MKTEEFEAKIHQLTLRKYDNLQYNLLGLSGETGEVLDAIKKVMRRHLVQVIEEFSDPMEAIPLGDGEVRYVRDTTNQGQTQNPSAGFLRVRTSSRGLCSELLTPTTSELSHIQEELGDVLYYLTRLAHLLGTNLTEIQTGLLLKCERGLARETISHSHKEA